MVCSLSEEGVNDLRPRRPTTKRRDVALGAIDEKLSFSPVWYWSHAISMPWASNTRSELGATWAILLDVDLQPVKIKYVLLWPRGDRSSGRRREEG